MNVPLNMSTEDDLNTFTRLRLAPFLKEAVEAVVVARPSDTIDFVIKFLTKNKDNLQRRLITEAIDYVNAGGKMENGADEQLLKQYESIKVRTASLFNLGLTYNLTFTHGVANRKNWMRSPVWAVLRLLV